MGSRSEGSIVDGCGQATCMFQSLSMPITKFHQYTVVCISDAPIISLALYVTWMVIVIPFHIALY